MGCAPSNAVAPTPVACEGCKYSLGDKIGKGAFAQVHVAQQKLAEMGNDLVAVKILTLQSKSSDRLCKKACRRALREICLWSRVGSHRNCVKMHEHFFEEDVCYIVMEKCSHGLFPHIKSSGIVTEESLADIFTQMLQGIAHMHSANIVHRDIKPDNFFVGGNDGQTIKLGDFGLAAVVPVGGKAAGVCGTAPYLCPEMWQHREVDLKADVWSFGILAYLLLCGDWPYNGFDPASVQMAIMRGPHPAYKEMSWLTESARLFLADLLTTNPSQRPRVASTLNKPFMKSKCKARRSLDTMFRAAEGIGALRSPSLNRQNDSLVDDLAKVDIGRNGKALAQNQMDDFIGATGEEIDKVVEDICSTFHVGCTRNPPAFL